MTKGMKYRVFNSKVDFNDLNNFYLNIRPISKNDCRVVITYFDGIAVDFVTEDLATLFLLKFGGKLVELWPDDKQ